LREHVLKPLLAAVTKPRLEPPPRQPSAIDQHYMVLRAQMAQRFEFPGLAA